MDRVPRHRAAAALLATQRSALLDFGNGPELVSLESRELDIDTGPLAQIAARRVAARFTDTEVEEACVAMGFLDPPQPQYLKTEAYVEFKIFSRLSQADKEFVVRAFERIRVGGGGVSGRGRAASASNNGPGSGSREVDDDENYDLEDAARAWLNIHYRRAADI